ncbi:MAG TPA: M14 family zinc carboxypeptidase [Bacteroidota bacterium]|nr:M14 family zinc carboxypeptidase [Bacteroidota bacterium]
MANHTAIPFRTIALELFETYESFKLPAIASRRFTQTELLQWLEPFNTCGLYQKTELGFSGEHRPLSLYTIGSGKTKVMLWSQMHGDESTATMALLDIFNFFLNNPQHPITIAVKESLALLVFPMVNPDGAERFTRRTAHGIDMNRDALALETPEARILKEVRDEYQPEFGFNLHDQGSRYSVGTTRHIAALALLAPAFDESRSENLVRTRAKHLAATFAQILEQFIPGHIAKWDDTFEPRAFGDNVQRWGTSTVLVESGGWQNDPEKFFIRKLNSVGLLTSLYAIATNQYQHTDTTLYEQIPFNTQLACDLIIRHAQLKANDHVQSLHVDIGINFEDVINPQTQALEKIATVAELGDLRTFIALQEQDARGAALDASLARLNQQFPAEKIHSLLRRS